MTIYKDKRNGHWCYKFRYQGTQYHKCFKDASFEDVKSFETVHKSELMKTGYDITSNRYNCPLSDIIKDYKEYAENNYARPKEINYVIELFFKIVGNKIAEQITLSDLEKYRKHRKDKVKNSSINREMDNIKRMFSLAKSNKKIRHNPCDELEDLRIDNPRKRFLQKDEEKKLLEVSNPLLKAIIITAIQTGMRCSEIKNLKWQDVFLKEKYLIALNPKNGKPRKLLITPDIERELLQLPKICDYVFANILTKDKYKDIKSTFTRAVKKAKIPKITFHELRHTTASRMNELGIDLSTIQEYLDHADARTTQGYIHKPKANILDAVYKLSQYNDT